MAASDQVADELGDRDPEVRPPLRRLLVLVRDPVQRSVAVEDAFGQPVEVDVASIGGVAAPHRRQRDPGVVQVVRHEDQCLRHIAVDVGGAAEPGPVADHRLEHQLVRVVRPVEHPHAGEELGRLEDRVPSQRRDADDVPVRRLVPELPVVVVVGRRVGFLQRLHPLAGLVDDALVSAAEVVEPSLAAGHAGVAEHVPVTDPGVLGEPFQHPRQSGQLRGLDIETRHRKTSSLFPCRPTVAAVTSVAGCGSYRPVSTVAGALNGPAGPLTAGCCRASSGAGCPAWCAVPATP